MGCKLLKTMQTMTTFRNPLADPLGTRRGPPLVRGPQFENRCVTRLIVQNFLATDRILIITFFTEVTSLRTHYRVDTMTSI